MLTKRKLVKLLDDYSDDAIICIKDQDDGDLIAIGPPKEVKAFCIQPERKPNVGVFRESEDGDSTCIVFD